MPVAPDYIAKAAQRALDARDNVPPSRKAGTPVGLARANQLVRGDNLSLNTLVRMRSFLERSKKNYDEAREQGLDLETSKAIQAYYLWGGPRALPWVNEQINKLQK